MDRKTAFLTIGNELSSAQTLCRFAGCTGEVLALRNSIAVFLACALSLTSCATRTVPFTGRSQTRGSSDARLNASAAQAYGQILATAVLCEDPAIVSRVTSVAGRLVCAIEGYFDEVGRLEDIAEFEWEFAVIESPEANAMCLPGGKIVVFTGLLEMTPRDSHLAAILGHEMAHALAHHAAEQIADQQMVQAMTGAMTSVNRSQYSQNVTQLYGRMAQLGLILPHSRFQEAEADHIGLILMALAGYDPRDAADVWRRMLDHYGDQGAVFMSTHPANSTRMKQLDALVPTVMPIYDLVSQRKAAE
jgi:predicted Zn-dependent protease